MEMVGTRCEREGEMMKAWGRRGTEEEIRFGTVSICAQNVCAIVHTGILYPVSPRRPFLFSEKKIQNKTTWPDCPRAVRHLAEWWLLGNSGKYITLETSKSNGILKVCFSGAGNSRMQEL
jgi:hypothetical protein